jgi:hypothetical protein
MAATGTETIPNRQAARAVGRCWGALFFSVFGGAWLLLAADALGRLNIVTGGAIGAVMVLFVVAGLLIQRRGQDAGNDAYPAAQRRRSDRLFGINNAVMWIAIFLVFQITSRLGHQDLAFPLVVLLVGLHFFAMPPLYRHRANLVTGVALTLWAIVCPLLFQGDRMIAFVAAGAGVVLWASAGWALKTARQLLRSAGL